jgi:hypothetical protein
VYRSVGISTRVLQPSHWPEDPLQRALYREAEVASLWKAFNIDGKWSAETVLNFAIYKKKNKVVGNKLMILLNIQSVLPISSADCKRMNLYPYIRKKPIADRNYQ